MQSAVVMRIWPTLVFVVMTTAPALADDRGLTSDEVKAELRPVSEQIEHCYTDNTREVTGAGHLDLVFTVSHRGGLDKLEVKTPGLSARVAKRVERCIREAVTPVSFPPRKGWTNATVPYFFQRTRAPNAGPQLSCWSPDGCPAKRAEKKVAARSAYGAVAVRSR